MKDDWRVETVSSGSMTGHARVSARKDNGRQRVITNYHFRACSYSLTKAITLLAMICVTFTTSACGGTRQDINISNAHRDRWPDKLLNRQRRHADNGILVYAQDWWIARKLARWTRTEISALEDEYGTKLTSEIVVFAIEPGDEPVTAIEAWQAKHIHRERKIVSSIHERYEGRRYCTSTREDPGFRESFFMPSSELQRLGLITSNAKGPALVFFFTSNRHKNESFDNRLKEASKTAVFVSDHWLMALVRAMTFRDYKQRDIKLMRLQRRETLWTGIVQMSGDDIDETERITRITKRINDEFQRILKGRPID